MPDTVKVTNTRGGSVSIDAEPLLNGQILYDHEAKRILLDAIIDGELVRLTMKEGIFTNSKSVWDSLTDEQKEVFTYVNFTDDYEFQSSGFVGATAEKDGKAGVVIQPLAGDQDKYLKGDGTWAIKPTYTPSEVNAIPMAMKGSVEGVAELDETGKVPLNQLPATLNLLEKYPTRADFPAVGDDNTLYVALDTNYTYRWTGVDYVQIDESIQLGETAATAYRGDRGKIAYDHATETKVGATASGFYKVASTDEGHIASLTAVAKADITALGIPAQDTTVLTSMTGTLAVGHGGTGATAAKAARANLASSRIVYNGGDPYASCNVGDVWIVS